MIRMFIKIQDPSTRLGSSTLEKVNIFRIDTKISMVIENISTPPSFRFVIY